MPTCSESHRSDGTARCSVCDGEFGLIRYYSWCTPLCFRKCVDRFRNHRAIDRNSLVLIWQQIALDQPSAKHRRRL
jgi:hypothetical protein